MEITNILFDLDGTLTDPYEGITRCIRYAMTELGSEPPENDDLHWCIGPPLIDSFKQLLNTTDRHLLERAVQLYRRRFGDTGLFENRVYPGIPEKLASLQEQGYRLFVATSKPFIFAEQILQHFNLSHFFEAIHGSQLNGNLTHKPQLVRHILVHEVLDPEQSMIIGDRKYDIVGGKCNGLITGAVTYGYGTIEELTAEDPDMVFNTPEQILHHPYHVRGADTPDLV